MATLIRPYVPSLGRMPESTTFVEVGLDTYTSSSQLCSGTAGTLMSNPKRIGAAMAICAVRERPPPALRASIEKRAREDTEGEKAREHHRAAEERVDKELDGRRPAVLVAPDADHEVHRDQRYLEEDVEQDQVLRREDPEHPDLGDEQDREVLLQVLAHVLGRDHRYEREQRRQEEHPEPEPVQPDPVADVERLDPGQVLGQRRGAQIVARRRSRRRSRAASGTAATAEAA